MKMWSAGRSSFTGNTNLLDPDYWITGMNISGRQVKINRRVSIPMIDFDLALMLAFCAILYVFLAVYVGPIYDSQTYACDAPGSSSNNVDPSVRILVRCSVIISRVAVVKEKATTRILTINDEVGLRAVFKPLQMAAAKVHEESGCPEFSSPLLARISDYNIIRAILLGHRVIKDSVDYG